MSDINIKEILKKAMVVIEYRNGDVDTEDGTFATTETDAIIGLEMSLAEAFNDDGDDATFLECWANIEKYCDKIQQLQSRNDELEAEKSALLSVTVKQLIEDYKNNEEFESPHVIFQMAQHVDELEARVQELQAQLCNNE